MRLLGDIVSWPAMAVVQAVRGLPVWVLVVLALAAVYVIGALVFASVMLGLSYVPPLTTCLWE